MNKKKILLIDDNQGILFIIKKALTMKDYKVYISDSFLGIEAVKKIAPDLIFLDISLVGMDGREVSKELKAHADTKHIPIIILTAYSGADDLAKEAQADDYLSKPFGLLNLFEKTAKYTAK